MPANASVASPAPLRALVVMVAAPQVPVRAHVAPTVMPEPTKDAKTIQVDTNAPVPAPVPTILAVEAVLGVLAELEPDL